jgi:hypothetical protein
MKMQAEAEKMQSAERMKMAELAATNEREQAKMAFEMQKHADQMELESQKLALQAAKDATEHERVERETERSQANTDRDYQLSARKADFDEAVSGVRRKEDGGVTTAEEQRAEGEAASRKELADAARAQAEAADRIAKAIEAASKASGAPKRVVRGQGRDMRIEPVTVQ